MLVLCDRQKSRVFAKVGQRHQRYLARNEAESQHLQTGLPRTRVLTMIADSISSRGLRDLQEVS